MLLKGVLPICQHLESQYLCIVFVDGICVHIFCAWYLCTAFVPGVDRGGGYLCIYIVHICAYLCTFMHICAYICILLVGGRVEAARNKQVRCNYSSNTFENTKL